MYSTFIISIFSLSLNSGEELLEIGRAALNANEFGKAEEIFSTLSQGTSGYVSSVSKYYLGMLSSKFDQAVQYLETYLSDASPSDSEYQYAVERYIALKALSDEQQELASFINKLSDDDKKQIWLFRESWWSKSYSAAEKYLNALTNSGFFPHARYSGVRARLAIRQAKHENLPPNSALALWLSTQETDSSVSVDEIVRNCYELLKKYPQSYEAAQARSKLREQARQKASGNYRLVLGPYSDSRRIDKLVSRLSEIGFNAEVKLTKSSSDKDWQRIYLGFYGNYNEAEQMQQFFRMKYKIPFIIVTVFPEENEL